MADMTSNRNGASSGSFLAGAAILLEIGAEYGVVDTLRSGVPVEPKPAAARSQIPETLMTRYLEALVHAGLAEAAGGDGQPRSFRAAPGLAQVIHDVGFVAWGFRACEPFITHAREFATTLGEAQKLYPRDGGLVARAAQWMGEKGFYPQTEEAILARRPRRIVDIGCGAGRLLVNCLTRLPLATAVGIDLDDKACAQARAAAAGAGVADRLTIAERSVQSLVDDASPLSGAEVIHAAWVLHDLLPDEEDTLDRLLAACCTTAPGATLVVAEAFPFARNEGEAPFSAAFSFLHENFMGRKFLTEAAWQTKLLSAGFKRVTSEQLVWPGGRLYTAAVG